MKEITYNIEHFIYDSKTRILHANSNELYPINGNYQIPFPNQRKQFFITNFKTGNTRRFRFVKQHDLPTKIALLFKDEDDDVSCIINLK